MDVSGNAEQFAGVEELEFVSAFVTLDKHEQLAKDLGEVAAVDLIDDEEVCVLLVVGCLLAEGVEGTLDKLKSRTGGPVPLDEVLVGVTLVELDQHDARGILDAHHRVGEALGGVGLSYARCSLHDDVLLRAQQAHDRVVVFLGHIDLSEELQGGVVREDYKWVHALNVVVAVLEERLNARKEFRVVGDLSEGLHGQSFVDWPVPCGRPADLPTIRVVAAVRVKDVVTRNNSSPEDLRASLLHENDIARLHLIRKLPQGVNVVLLGTVFGIGLEHLCLQIFLMCVGSQIPNLTPCQSHDSARVELVPHAGAPAGGVEPIAHGLHVGVPQGSLLGNFFLLFVSLFVLTVDKFGRAQHTCGKLGEGCVCVLSLLHRTADHAAPHQVVRAGSDTSEGTHPCSDSLGHTPGSVEKLTVS